MRRDRRGTRRRRSMPSASARVSGRHWSCCALPHVASRHNPVHRRLQHERTYARPAAGAHGNGGPRRSSGPGRACVRGGTWEASRWKAGSTRPPALHTVRVSPAQPPMLRLRSHSSAAPPTSCCTTSTCSGRAALAAAGDPRVAHGHDDGGAGEMVHAAPQSGSAPVGRPGHAAARRRPPSFYWSISTAGVDSRIGCLPRSRLVVQRVYDLPAARARATALCTPAPPTPRTRPMMWGWERRDRAIEGLISRFFLQKNTTRG